ncbi:MAG: SHOCT domain-containing protein [Anaeroplasmataceae bacterium]|nr:SHOCT domain-containing protein [Anaeroplasmataceae bacterium]
MIEEALRQIADSKKTNSSVNINQVSAADELKKFKELLDTGIITQEEFNTKKKELLGL